MSCLRTSTGWNDGKRAVMSPKSTGEAKSAPREILVHERAEGLMSAVRRLRSAQSPDARDELLLRFGQRR